MIKSNLFRGFYLGKGSMLFHLIVTCLYGTTNQTQITRKWCRKRWNNFFLKGLKIGNLYLKNCYYPNQYLGDFSTKKYKWIYQYVLLSPTPNKIWQKVLFWFSYQAAPAATYLSCYWAYIVGFWNRKFGIYAKKNFCFCNHFFPRLG